MITNPDNPGGADNTDLTYRGYGPGSTAGGRLVVIEIAGEVIGPLPHAVKHSPTGMTWGYAGSGPADLARSLLIHALGDDARCTVCDGSNNVVYDTTLDNDVPAHRAHDIGSVDETLTAARFSPPMRCLACDGGWALQPATYQRFKFEVIAGLPERGWTLTRAEVLAWYQRHRQQDPS